VSICWRRPLLYVALLATLATAQEFAFPSLTLAFGETNCQTALGGPPSFWRGQQWTDSNQKHGASATAEGYPLRRCTNPGLPIEIDGSFVFSNLTPAGGGFNDIVQVGYGHARCPVMCPDDEESTYAWGRTHTTAGCSGYSDTAPTVHFTSVGSGGSGNKVYKVVHTANRYQGFVGTSKVLDFTETSICWTPKNAVWFGETWDVGDQLGGDANNHLLVWNLQYTNSEGGGWFSTQFGAPNCNFAEGSGTSAYHCQRINTNQFDIWTDNR